MLTWTVCSGEVVELCAQGGRFALKTHPAAQEALQNLPRANLNYRTLQNHALSRVSRGPRLIFGVTFAFLLFLLVGTVGTAEAQAVTANTSPALTTGASQFAAGYSGNVTVGTTFTMLDASWNFPAVSCQPNLGVSQQVVTMIRANTLTVGFEEFCKAGSTSLTIMPFAYFPPVNAKPVPLKLKVKAGDSVYALIIIDPKTNSVNGTLLDVTTDVGVHYIKTVPNAAKSAQGFFIGISRGGFGLFTTTDLAKFGTAIKFLGCSYDLNGIGTAPFLDQVAMKDTGGKTMALTSGLSGGGGTFSVTWLRSA